MPWLREPRAEAARRFSVGEKRKTATGCMALILQRRGEGDVARIELLTSPYTYICLNRCVNCREIGSFSCRFLSRMNWRSASSRSTPDTAVEIDDRAAVHLPELLGVELRRGGP